MGDHTTITSDQVGDVHILRITVPDLSDRDIVRMLEQQICDYVRSRKPTKLVLDFAEVRFLTSDMLSVLLRVRDLAHAKRGAIRLTSLSPIVREIFRITRLDRIFPITDAADAAVAAFAG